MAATITITITTTIITITTTIITITTIFRSYDEIMKAVTWVIYHQNSDSKK